MPTVRVLRGPDKGRTYPTPATAAVIGRNAGQISLSDHSASRWHAEIRPDNGSWMLRDLESSNGTFLNGKRVVAPVPLKHGDKITIGSTLMVFRRDTEADGAPGPTRTCDPADVDLRGDAAGSSIIAAVDGSTDSVLLNPPQTAEAVAAWNVVYRIAESIGATDSVAVFLDRATDILLGHLIADNLALFTWSADRDEPVPAVIRLREAGSAKRAGIVASRTIINHVRDTREGVLCADAMADARFGSGSKHDSIHKLGLRSVICVPLVANGHMHGVLHVDCSASQHTYTHEQLRLVMAVARLIGMAIQNARLLESRVRTERLAAAGQTVAHMSHHIRNILQGLSGGADVVEMGLRRKDLKTAASGWSLVKRNLDRTYDLATNMLTFSKSRQPRIELVQINIVIMDVVSLIDTRAKDKGVTVHTDLRDVPPVPMDPNGMHQVIHNILTNAIEAVPARAGEVTISTRVQKDGRHAVVSITDNGPGIPPDLKSRIFEAFESTKGQGGTGLGLAAAKKIIDELKGEIELDSELGNGTSFHVKIPVERTPTNKSNGAPASTAVPL